MAIRKNQYYVWLKQRGEGCDYTIGCAEHLVKIKSTEDQDLLQKRVRQVVNDYADYSIDTALVLKLVDDADDFVRAAEEQLAQERARQDRAKKMEELERLKKELGVE